MTLTERADKAVAQQLHLLRGVFKHEFLRLGKLRDHTQPRSTLLLGRATFVGLSRRRKSRDNGTHNGAHRQPLRRGRRPKERKCHKKQMQDFRKVPIRTHLLLHPTEAAPCFRVLEDSMASSSAAPSRTSNAIRLADTPANKIQPRSINDPTVNLNQNT